MFVLFSCVRERRLKAAFERESVQTDYGRGSLLDTGTSRGLSSDPWSADVESDNTRNKGISELRQQQTQIIAGKISEITGSDFDQDTRVDETFMQTLACQLSCNSCSRLTRT